MSNPSPSPKPKKPRRDAGDNTYVNPINGPIAKSATRPGEHSAAVRAYDEAYQAYKSGDMTYGSGPNQDKNVIYSKDKTNAASRAWQDTAKAGKNKVSQKEFGRQKLRG